MSSAIVFEVPALWFGALPLGLLLCFAAWRQWRRGLASRRVVALLVLRSLSVALLLFLAARPTRISRERDGGASRPVVVLVDRSQSMSLAEAQTTRYDRALAFLRDRLLPALKAADVPVQGMIFDQTAKAVTGEQMTSTKPEGKRTNLGAAIVEALSGPRKPLAVVALTDGSSNETADDARAMSRLATSGVPFIGVGFGSDEGVQTLSLRRLEAPVRARPKTVFNLSAEMEMVKGEPSAVAELVLFRDGQLLQKKVVKLQPGWRTWVENFEVSEPVEGEHNYNVQLLGPDLPNLKCLNDKASASVRVANEKELRVLYIQGALTWDYKFIRLALEEDPEIKLTGLTRTSNQSVFRQNVENTIELVNGFPTSIEELAPDRVVVLANLRPEDLSLQQQELLRRFCGEFGGGLLLIGGAATFDPSWENSRLEKLLPVVFSNTQFPPGTDADFHLELTPEALQNPLFRLSEDLPVQEVWRALPAFNQFGRVDSPKKGAIVWICHPSESGPRGRRVLMASQRYGAGLSAVICLQNFWRWRLAKDSDPRQFDRFWRQFFRWLAQAGKAQVSIQLADQELRPHRDIGFSLQREPQIQVAFEKDRRFLVEVADPHKRTIQSEALELTPSQPQSCRFRAEAAGLYTVRVLDSSRVLISERTLEIRESDVELEQTARSMETLAQWAALSDGLAFKVEECPQPRDLAARIKTKVEEMRRNLEVRHIVGLNVGTLSLILGGLAGEWMLRKRWALL